MWEMLPTVPLRGTLVEEREPAAMEDIPPFRPDGYLPEGLFLATEAEVTFRFGAASGRRRGLVFRVRGWIELARQIKARRLLVDGSFVTAKGKPQDVDAVLYLPPDFNDQILAGSQAALEMEEMLLMRRPEEIFAAEDDMTGTNGLNSSAEQENRMADVKAWWKLNYDCNRYRI